MSENDPSQFVVHRLRSKPVAYSVGIRHFVSGGEWSMGVEVRDLADTPEDRRRVADDLRRAATLLEESVDEQPGPTTA